MLSKERIEQLLNDIENMCLDYSAAAGILRNAYRYESIEMDDDLRLTMQGVEALIESVTDRLRKTYDKLETEARDLRISGTV